MNTIGHYQVLEHRGDGGMGAVYKARDPRFDRTVALKVLQPQRARSPEVVERFKSEAIIQAKLNHPNIATVHDFVADGVMAMVMEFIDGETLESVIAGIVDAGAPRGALHRHHAIRCWARSAWRTSGGWSTVI